MPGSTGSMPANDAPDRLPRRFLGTRSPQVLVLQNWDRRRWQSRRFAASTRSLPWSARSTAPRPSGGSSVRQQPYKPIVVDLEQWMRAERAWLSRHAETAPDQQCRRAGAARDRNRPQGLAVRWLRPRRRARCFDVDADRDREAQRHRPAGLARRRLASHRRSSGLPPQPAPSWHWKDCVDQAAALLDPLSRRGTQRMPTPVQRLGRLHRLLIRAHAQRLPEADSSCQ